MDVNGNGVPDCAEHVRLWLRADRGVMVEAGDAGVPVPAKDGAKVVLWKDMAPGGRDAKQTTPNRRPTWIASVSPVGPGVRFEGDGKVGDLSATAKDDSLDGPSLLSGGDARTFSSWLGRRQGPPAEGSACWS